MIVRSSTTTLQVAHLQQSSLSTRQTVRAWVGDRPGSVPAPTAPPSTALIPTAPPSTALIPTAPPSTGLIPTAPPSTEPATAQGPAADAQDRLTRLPRRLAEIITLVEWLTGQKVDVLDAEDLGRGHAGRDAAASAVPTTARSAPPRQRVGWGVEVTSTQIQVDREATAVHASSSVTTADGRHLDVAVDVALARQTSSTSTSRLLAGDAAFTDPLMLGFGGPAALGSGAAGFDLDGDGAEERLPDAAAASAFLVLDRNGNGILDDGGELFGPASGDGFAELAALDDDGNGWIDEGDAVFARLGLAAAGHGEVTSLAGHGVGAIGLARVSSPFTFVTGPSGDEVSGRLRSTGLWIGEDGSAGVVQQIDVAG